MEQSYLTFLISGLALYFLWYYGWKSYHLDNYRNNLFAIRDDLFDKGLDGTIPFSSGTYAKMCYYVNAHIRYAHRFTFTDGIGAALIVGNEGTKEDNLGNAAVWSVGVDEPDVRTYIKQFERRVDRATLGFITSYNLFFLALKATIWGAAKLSRLRVKWLRSIIKSIENLLEGRVRNVIYDLDQSPQIGWS